MVKKLDNHDFLEFLNKTYGTRDTDGDGICDEVEVMIGTDPAKADTDNDGMSDGEEIRAGRNPLGPGDFRDFQDFFLPHEGNDYRPQALHPKRLLFYVTSAVAVKVLLVAFVVGLPMTAWLSPDMMREQSEKIVKLTNSVRSDLGLMPLVENQNLAMAAYDKAQDMLLSQYFAHTGPDGRSVRDWLAKVNYTYEVAGENLAMGFAEPREVVDAWVKSPTHYANLIDPEYSEIGVGMTSGAYQGSETTLVAQYFGEPKTVSTLQAKAATSPNLKLAKTEGAEPRLALALGLDKGLAKPEIIEPKSGLLTNASDLMLLIKAPGVEKLIVKDRDKVLVESIKNASDEYGRVNLQLEEGQHELRVVASDGKDNILSESVVVNVDLSAPGVDIGQAKVWLENLVGSQDQVLKIQVPLDSSAASAQVFFADKFIDLRPVTEDSKIWSAQTIIYGDQERSKSLVMPVLSVKDEAGNSRLYDLPVQNIKPLASSWTEKYFFLKNNPNKAVDRMFDVTTIFYRILIIMTGLALALAITLEKKRQSKKTLATTVAFAIFILFLLVI
ncbi:MAG TPA: CAP domain-containing protein [bacterium]|nr:CAP domain-containing protein [bacterium]